MSLIIRDRALVIEEEHEVEEELKEALKDASNEVQKRAALYQQVPPHNLMEDDQQREVTKLVSKQVKKIRAEKDGLLDRLRKFVPSEVCDTSLIITTMASCTQNIPHAV